MTEKGIARTNSPVGAQDKEQEGTESFLSGRDCGRLPTGPNTPCAEDPLPARPGAGGGLCEARPTLPRGLHWGCGLGAAPGGSPPRGRQTRLPWHTPRLGGRGRS